MPATFFHPVAINSGRIIREDAGTPSVLANAFALGWKCGMVGDTCAGCSARVVGCRGRVRLVRGAQRAAQGQVSNKRGLAKVSRQRQTTGTWRTSPQYEILRLQDE